MRRLGLGQTLKIWLIPEVGRLVSTAARHCQLAETDRSLISDTMAWLVVNTLRGEKLQAAKLQDLQAATVVRTLAIKKLLEIAPSLAQSASLKASLDAETEEQIDVMATAHTQEVAVAEQVLQVAKEKALEACKATQREDRNRRMLRLSTQKDGDDYARKFESAMAATAKDFNSRKQALQSEMREHFEQQKAAVYAKRATEPSAPTPANDGSLWLQRCMMVLIEPMEFGVASTVGGHPRALRKPTGYDEACTSLLAAKTESEPELALQSVTLAPAPSPSEGVPNLTVLSSLALAEQLNDRLRALSNTLEYNTPSPTHSSPASTLAALPSGTGILSESLKLAYRLGGDLGRLQSQIAHLPSSADSGQVTLEGGCLLSRMANSTWGESCVVTAEGTPVGEAASVFYDNEVQNEKEQEQQVQPDDVDDDNVMVYPGAFRPFVSRFTLLCRGNFR